MGKRLVLIIVVSLAMIAAFSPTISVAAEADAQVRVIHASPDTPPVDVYIDGAKAIAALGFTKASDYRPIAVGKHDFQLYQAGTTPTSSDPVVQAKGIIVPAGAKLSLVGIGWLASIRTLVVDDRAPTPAPGKAELRFVHVGPDVQALDFAIKGGAVLVSNSQFGNAYPYQEVDTRPSELEIRPAGTLSGVVALGFAPEAGRTYSAYLMSLGALKVLLDTTASDATVAATNPAANAPTSASPLPSAATSPAANATTTTSPTGSVGLPPFLGVTGHTASRRPFDVSLSLIGLAGGMCISGGLAIRRRAARRRA